MLGVIIVYSILTSSWKLSQEATIDYFVDESAFRVVVQLKALHSPFMIVLVAVFTSVV